MSVVIEGAPVYYDGTTVVEMPDGDIMPAPDLSEDTVVLHWPRPSEKLGGAAVDASVHIPDGSSFMPTPDVSYSRGELDYGMNLWLDRMDSTTLSRMAKDSQLTYAVLAISFIEGRQNFAKVLRVNSESFGDDGWDVLRGRQFASADEVLQYADDFNAFMQRIEGTNMMIEYKRIVQAQLEQWRGRKRPGVLDYAQYRSRKIGEQHRGKKPKVMIDRHGRPELVWE